MCKTKNVYTSPKLYYYLLILDMSMRQFRSHVMMTIAIVLFIIDNTQYIARWGDLWTLLAHVMLRSEVVKQITKFIVFIFPIVFVIIYLFFYLFINASPWKNKKKNPPVFINLYFVCQSCLLLIRQRLFY